MEFRAFRRGRLARSYGNGSHDNEFAVSIGLLNNIRLSNLLDLTLEARHMFVNQRFDGVARGNNGEGMTSVTLGLSFKLNRRGFKRVAPPVVPDYTPYQNRIKALENDNADLTGRNKTLLAENEALRNRQPEKETVSSGIGFARGAVFCHRQGYARQKRTYES